MARSFLEATELRFGEAVIRVGALVSVTQGGRTYDGEVIELGVLEQDEPDCPTPLAFALRHDGPERATWFAYPDTVTVICPADRD